MKTIKSNFTVLFFAIFSLLTGLCDNREYYKTFDYRTMTFVEPTSKSDFCVRKISQTDSKIEMEVFFDGNRIKRTFIKEENYWLSKYKYETVKEPFFATIYGQKFEYDYFIYNDHIISKQDFFVIDADLIQKKISYYQCYDDMDIKVMDLSKIHDKLWGIRDFYTMYGDLYSRTKYFENGKFMDEGVDNDSSLYADLDFFFLIDFEIYQRSSGIKRIYD